MEKINTELKVLMIDPSVELTRAFIISKPEIYDHFYGTKNILSTINELKNLKKISINDSQQLEFLHNENIKTRLKNVSIEQILKIVSISESMEMWISAWQHLKLKLNPFDENQVIVLVNIGNENQLHNNCNNNTITNKKRFIEIFYISPLVTINKIENALSKWINKTPFKKNVTKYHVTRIFNSFSIFF